MGVHKSSFRTLMHFYAGVKSTEVWHMMWLFAGTLIWYHTHTHTHTHTAHSGVSRMIDPYKYIFKPTVTCSQQLSLLQWMKNSMTSNIFFPYCLFFSKIMLIRCYKTRFFLWNTNNTDRNGVNKTHTHTHTYTRNTQRKITLERVS